jgi:L-2-hydroxyglutarate oxidase LhgO
MGKNVVIIGGGAGGASVAAEAKRMDPSLSIALVEGGSYTSVAA